MNLFTGGGETGDDGGVAVVAVGLPPGPACPDSDPLESGDRALGRVGLSVVTQGSSLTDSSLALFSACLAEYLLSRPPFLEDVSNPCANPLIPLRSFMSTPF